MSAVASFPFLPHANWLGEPLFMPLLPVELSLNGGRPLYVNALLDTGATVCVLPFDAGLQLGGAWERQPPLGTLSGNLAQSEARGLLVDARIAGFEPICLSFAWVRSNNVPILLGHVNFFHEFDAGFQARCQQFRLQLAADTDRAP